MSTITQLIEREIALISRFVSLLQQEQETLKHARIAELPALTAEKSALVEQLNTLEGERLLAIGVKPNERAPLAMEAWLKNNPGERLVAERWQKLLELARQAKNTHLINARLLDMHARQTTELLAALTRQAENPALYGASGQTMPTSGSRIIDSA